MTMAAEYVSEPVVDFDKRQKLTRDESYVGCPATDAFHHGVAFHSTLNLPEATEVQFLADHILPKATLKDRKVRVSGKKVRWASNGFRVLDARRMILTRSWGPSRGSEGS